MGPDGEAESDIRARYSWGVRALSALDARLAAVAEQRRALTWGVCGLGEERGKRPDLAGAEERLGLAQHRQLRGELGEYLDAALLAILGHARRSDAELARAGLTRGELASRLQRLGL